jgi:hypothetical protein
MLSLLVSKLFLFLKACIKQLNKYPIRSFLEQYSKNNSQILNIDDGTSIVSCSRNSKL